MIYHFILYSVQANVNNQKCASNEECDGTKSLTCKEGVCACKEDKLYWNTKAANCGSLLIFTRTSFYLA